MDLGLKDKVALVMASSKGLGKSVARQLINEGAKVVICGTDLEALQSSEKEFDAISPGHIYAVQCDLNIAEQRKNLVEKAVEKFGNIQILVSNTGGPDTGPFEQHSLADWHQMYNNMFLSIVDIIQQVLPNMKKNHYGRILMITSIAAKQPEEDLISSNSIRAGIVGFMKSLSNEVATYEITVNNIMPGFTQTKRLDSLMRTSPHFRTVQGLIPMKRFGFPEEFGSTAAFLVSERASYITGASIPVDGGWIKSI